MNFVKSFCIVFEKNTSSESFSGVQLAKLYGVSKTFMVFKERARESMQSSKNYKLHVSNIYKGFEEYFTE